MSLVMFFFIIVVIFVIREVFFDDFAYLRKNLKDFKDEPEDDES